MSMSQSLESMRAETLHQVLPVVIAWALEAAREHLHNVQHFGETRDPEFCMGLRQSFERKFPDWADRPAFEKDLMLNTASHTYRYTVLDFSEWTAPDPYAR